MTAAELERWLSEGQWRDYQSCKTIFDRVVIPSVVAISKTRIATYKSLAECKSLLYDVTLVEGLDWETYALAHNIKPGHGDSVDFLKRIEKHLLGRIEKCIAGYPRASRRPGPRRGGER